MSDPTDAMIEAARNAICMRQRSLIGKITKSSIRDALIAANDADDGDDYEPNFDHTET